MLKPHVSIILPTYNEAENIIDLIKRIDVVVKKNREIIVVDDNSPDGTSKLVRKLINSHEIKNLQLITRFKDHGLTKSIWEGIEKSKGEIIVWMDCDFSHPPEIIPKLILQVEEGYDIAVASRFAKGGGFKKNTNAGNDSILQVTLSRIMNYSIQLLLNSGFKDYTSGFIAIKRKIFKEVKLQGDYGEYFIDLMFRSICLGYKFTEIPFVNLPRKYGETKTGSSLKALLKRGTKYITTTLKLVYIGVLYKLRIKDDIRSQDEKFK